MGATISLQKNYGFLFESDFLNLVSWRFQSKFEKYKIEGTSGYRMFCL